MSYYWRRKKPSYEKVDLKIGSCQLEKVLLEWLKDNPNGTFEEFLEFARDWAVRHGAGK